MNRPIKEVITFNYPTSSEETVLSLRVEILIKPSEISSLKEIRTFLREEMSSDLYKILSNLKHDNSL